ncbi:MAG: FAD-dependent oxidoreductase [Proteobacteria bacterium]|nr:FAD-dependent oxidoreductase [Pseudomonadota bacterium]NBP16127.1 FAD-dependent oxidoreductase [bacterium]
MIAVVGAGIAGITSAYFLTRAGHRVVVYERESYPAMQCSYANGGQVSTSNSQTWNTWSNVLKGIKWLGRKDAPLLIRPSLDWDKAKWLAKFLYHTASNDWARNTAATIRMGIESRSLYNQIEQDEYLEYDRLNKGILHVYRNQKYYEEAMQLKELYEDNGCEWNIINSRDELVKIEPSLKYFNGLLGGIFTPSDWTGDIHNFCWSLFKVLNTKYDVKFYFHQSVHNINELENYDHVVIANGSHARHTSKQIGDSLPIYPVKGYSVTIPLDTPKSIEDAPYVSLLDDEAKIVSSRLGNSLRIAGTAEITGDDWDIRKDRIEPLLTWVKDNFPYVETRGYKSWACLRPMTPNMMPIVSRSRKNKKVFYHVGHGHLGWTLAPATAMNLVKLIKGN